MKLVKAITKNRARLRSKAAKGGYDVKVPPAELAVLVEAAHLLMMIEARRGSASSGAVFAMGVERLHGKIRSVIDGFPIHTPDNER